MRSAITVCLVPEARSGPFVFHQGLEPSLAAAAKLGFDGVEIFPTHADDLDGLVLRDALRDRGLQLAAVGTGAGWLRHRLSLTDPDGRLRMRARDFIGAVIDFAGGFGAPAIVGSMQGRAQDGVGREWALQWLREELDQLGPRAAALGAPLLFEPLNRYETNLFNTVSDALAFLDTLRTRNVRLLCDLFHMNIEEADIGEALRMAGPRLGHVHFADTNRRAVGLGHLDAGSVARALNDANYQGWLSAEVFPLPDPETAARQTRGQIRALFARR